VKGQTTSTEAKQQLLLSLKGAGYEPVDSLRLLPDAEKLAGKTYGVVNLSVANLRIEPDFSSEMVTQALLGMPVRLLDRGGWYRVQTPDEYIAWVHSAGIHPMSKEEYNRWNTAEKVVVTAPFGFAYSAPLLTSQTVSDVVSGDRLKWEGEVGDFFQVSYPDGRPAYLPKASGAKEGVWRGELKQDAAAWIRSAYTLMGTPYLWAGTSTKGVDCSGFIRTTLFMQDIIIPRDASQQALVGERLEFGADFSNLQPCDLLFFGRKAAEGRRERVVHVGLYLGDKQFIHSQGDVRVGSLDVESPIFDLYNLNRLLFATRILPYINKVEKISTTSSNRYYQNQE
jgi:cell wall-associated NlpC family hydrolase